MCVCGCACVYIIRLSAFSDRRLTSSALLALLKAAGAMMMNTRQLIPFLLLILLTWTAYGVVTPPKPKTKVMMKQMRAELDSLNTSYSQKAEEVDQLQQNLSSLSAKVDRQQSVLDAKTRRSAFLATFAGNRWIKTPRSGPFKFNRTIFNDGDDYDTNLGVYEAPIAGVYSLGVQLYFRTQDLGYPVVDLKVNGIMMNRMAISKPKYWSAKGEGTLTSTLPFKLKAGDKVWVEGKSVDVYTIWGLYHSFFSAVLLYPE